MVKDLVINNIKAAPFLLAPMEDVSDLAFRMTCKQYGAGIVYTEMNHAASLVRGNERRAIISEEERPIGIQVAGKDIPEIVEAAKLLEDRADLIDVNLGCPGPNVIKRGYGSALLEDPELIGEIISALVGAVNIPVTAKMRAGYKTNEDFMKIAQVIEKSGASALGVHPRTKTQKYSGRADWSIIKAIKDNLSIPIIGNGDVTTAQAARQMFEETSCDAVMIGRGAIGNPMIFEKIRLLFEEGVEEETTPEERIKGFELYVHYAKKFDLYMKTRIMRQAMHFSKGMDGSVELRRKIMKMDDLEEIERVTKEFLSSPLLSSFKG